MFLVVDISRFVVDLFNQILNFLSIMFGVYDDIIVVHLGSVNASLLDFMIGILVVGIVLGAFLHLTKADQFYGDK